MDTDQPNLPSFQQHQTAGSRFGPLGFAVITMSDSRTPETDTSGQFIKDAVTAAGHRVARYALVPDEPQRIRPELEAALDDAAVAIVVTNGGTGISLRDNAYETVVARLDKRLDGFGELFRMLSYSEIGAAAMLSRAVGGVASGRIVFSLPGSTKAVRLGMEKLILPQAGHLWFELQKHAQRK
ncbi:MAG: MogA/MoaB family molybdenum cofactor biosynthesis protein [Planctomycetaceae bacterium]|nr:MogA/MoaB family molybdenum cofactor biosynthesis protein [Planctomycetaceae bacterium]